jgi:hypothetical protein
MRAFFQFILLQFFIGTTLLSQTQPRLVLPVGNLGGVTKLDNSPSGNLLLTQDLNSDIIIYDRHKLLELQRHNYRNQKLSSSTFLNDSSVICINNDTIISIWNFYLNKTNSFKIPVHLSKIYSQEFGLFGIDLNDNIFKLKISFNTISLEKFGTTKAKDVYFKSQNEFFLVDEKKLIFINTARNQLVKKKFNSNISALTWNKNGNVLLGFENGTITEFDSILNISHNFLSMSDRISTINYFGDSLIISGAYDFSLVTQNKKGFVNSILLDDWVVGLMVNNSNAIVCSWNGRLVELDNGLSVNKEFQAGLKKSTFFNQKDNFLFISYNDGSIGKYDLIQRKETIQYKISNIPILGFDLNHDASEIICWTDKRVIVFNTKNNKITADRKISSVFSGKFIPNSSNYLFCSIEYLYFFNKKQILDSIPIIDSWSIIETRDNSLIVSGLNRFIEINIDGAKIRDVKNVGLICTCNKTENGIYVLGTISGGLYKLTAKGKLIKIAQYNMPIDNIEILNIDEVIVNCENGHLIYVNLKTKKSKIIADSGQEYGSWDFKVNVKSDKIIYPNSKTWDYKMNVDVLDLNGKLLNKLENVGGEVICVSNSNKSIEFNKLDSNQVIFIVSDGSVKLWDINSDGKDPITQLGFNYYNLLKSELKDFNLNGAFLKSGLLKLPIPGIDTLTFMNLKNGDWIVHDSKYRFDGTPGAIEKLYFTCGLEVVELNQVKDSLYVPNLVQRYLNGEKFEHIPEINNLRICGYTPLVDPIDSLNFKITPRNGGVGNVDVFINGIQRLTFNNGDLKSEKGIYVLKIDEKQINQYKTPGVSLEIKVVAKTADNSVSSRGVVIEMVSDTPKTKLKPSIHAVMIGVDNYKDKTLELRYAAKDANDLHKTLELAAINYLNIDDTNRVFFYNLTVSGNGKNGTENIRGITPDRGNIIKTLQEIEKSSKPEDIILLFFAGHGEIVDNEQLLLLTTESTRDNFQGIKMNELLSIMNKIPAGKRILILDACHSGAAINNLDLAYFSGKRDVNDVERESQRLKELDKLANKSGFCIITASSSDQKALELPQYEHGLLTYSLLSTLVRNKTVLNEDNQLVLEKWFIAAEEEMKNLNKNQDAEKMVPVSFNIGLVNEEVIKSIQISEIPMLEIGEIINENQFINDFFPLDNLQINEKINRSFQVLNQAKNQKIYIIEKGDFRNYKLIIKYQTSESNIKLKFTVIKNDLVIMKIERDTSTEMLEKSLNEIAIEILNQL